MNEGGGKLPLTAAQQRLVHSVQHVVVTLARRYTRRTRLLKYDDLHSLGSAGSVEAACTYDPARETAFEGFAYKRIEGSIRTGIRRERRHRERLIQAGDQACGEFMETTTRSFNVSKATETKVGDAYDDEVLGAVASTLLGVVSEVEQLHGEELIIERLAHEKAIDAVRGALASLPERDRQILEGHYWKRIDLKKIAKNLGVSYPTVLRFRHDAEVRLGRRLTRLGVTESPLLSGA